MRSIIKKINYLVCLPLDYLHIGSNPGLGDASGMIIYFFYLIVLCSVLFYPFGALRYYYNNVEQQCNESFITEYNANTTLTLDPDCLHVKIFESPNYETYIQVRDRADVLYAYRYIPMELTDRQKQRMLLPYKDIKCWFDGNRVTFNPYDVNLHPIQTVNFSDPVILHKYIRNTRFPCCAVISHWGVSAYGAEWFIIAYVLAVIVSFKNEIYTTLKGLNYKLLNFIRD